MSSSPLRGCHFLPCPLVSPSKELGDQVQNHGMSARRKKERVAPTLPRHNRPLPQQKNQKNHFSEEKREAREMWLQMESWFLQAVHPRGERLALPSAERHQ